MKEFFQHILSQGYDEIMFEFMLYAVHKRVPYFLLSQHRTLSPYAVHVRGIDPACQHSNGEVYNDLSVIDRLDNRRVMESKGQIALMCLMNGTAPMDDRMEKYLAMGSNIFTITTAMFKYASQWMTGKELGRLSNARERVLAMALDRRPPGPHRPTPTSEVLRGETTL